MPRLVRRLRNLCFHAKHVQYTPLHPKTKLGFFLMFGDLKKTVTKTGPVGALNAQVRAPTMKLVFSRQTCPIHSISTKNLFWVCISCFGRLQKPTRKHAPLVQMPRFVRRLRNFCFRAKHVESTDYTQKPSSGFISCFGQLQNPAQKRAP